MTIIYKRKSNLTGNEGAMTLPLTEAELKAGLARSWSANPNGNPPGTEHMQNIFPQLSAEQREFLMTGITPEEWDDMMGPDPDDEDGE